MIKWLKYRFKKELHIKIDCDVGIYSAVATPSEACEYLSNCDNPKQYRISEIWMTQQEYDSMPEFEGF